MRARNPNRLPIRLSHKNEGVLKIIFNYGTPDHHARDCKAPNRFGHQDVVYYNYRKTGHINKNCNSPRKGNYGQTLLDSIILEDAGYKGTGYEGTKYREQPPL